MIVTDNTALVRGQAEAVVYTGRDPVFHVERNQPLIDRIVAIKRIQASEREAAEVRLWR